MIGITSTRHSDKSYQIKALTDRRCPRGWDTTKSELNTVLRGWFNYFRLGIRRTIVKADDGWTRRRIRQMYWKSWKKNRTRIKELEKLGISKDKAYQWGNTSKSYWRVSGSFILCRTLTNETIKEEGGTYFQTYLMMEYIVVETAVM